jgi:hypothetical protein
MNERDYLAERFEEHRTHLRPVAYRMLGSLSEVDDAVQEAWLRLSRAASPERVAVPFSCPASSEAKSSDAYGSYSASVQCLALPPRHLMQSV